MIATDTVRLNLGCGTDIREGWINVDFQEGDGVDVVADLELDGFDGLPFEANSVDEMLLSHVIEHLRHPLLVMQNLWEIAKPDCKLTIRVPHGASDDAWEDPTHVRPYFLQSFGYFSQPYHWRSQGYGYSADWQPETVTLIVGNKYVGMSKEALFEQITYERNIVREMVAVLRKVSPIREAKRDLIKLPVFLIEAVA